MFGLACKGLHCAGCGKGIPLGIVIILLGVVSQVNGVMVEALASVVMWGAFVVGACIVATGTAISLLQRNDFQMVYSKWDGPTMVQTKTEETWADRAQVGSYNPMYETQEHEELAS